MLTTQSLRLLLVATVLLSAHQAVEAQGNNGQGKILWAMAQWLSGSDAATPLMALGWNDGGNPCTGWGGVACNGEGFVTSINLAGRGLAGSIPTDPGLWAGMTGLTNLDLSNNQLAGTVPAAIKSAPLLNSINVQNNQAVCGFLPNGLSAQTGGTTIGQACPPTSPSASPSSPATSPSPAAVPPSPSPTPTPSPSPAMSPAVAPEQAVVATAQAPKAAPATEISSAPICSCALKGFGSQDCAGALAKECRGTNPPAVCASTASVLNDTSAATALGQYLADTCFTGQNMDTSICTCVQNLLGNDCAKARVSLCVRSDPLCLPVQNVVADSDAPGTPAAAQQVASALDAQCIVGEPSQPGVKATMEFPGLTMGQYINKQYTQNVANALSSVTNVPTSAINTLDVRPFTGAARVATPRRHLLQTAGNNGVQATYFLATDDPTGVSQKLSNAANDGTLSSRLAQYGITAQAGGLRVQNYLQPPAAAAPVSSQPTFPLWALAPIIAGGLLLLGLGAALLWCCCCRTRGKKAPAFAPGPIKNQQQSFQKAPSAGARSNSDLGGARDMGQQRQSSQNAPGTAAYAAGNGYRPAGASPPTYKAPSNVTPVVYAKVYERGPASGRPDSPGSSKGSSVSRGAPLGVAGAAGGLLVSSRSQGTDYYEAPIAATASNSSSITRTGSGAGLQAKAAAAAAGLQSGGMSSGSMRAVPLTVGAGSAAATGAANSGLTRSGSVGVGSEGGSGSPAWRSNVRSVSGGGATGMLAKPAANSQQQAERARFWAQFAATWSQVRQTQDGRQPGSPTLSEGTAWSDVTEVRPNRH